jgi:hypothetical protein
MQKALVSISSTAKTKKQPKKCHERSNGRPKIIKFLEIKW